MLDDKVQIFIADCSTWQGRLLAGASDALAPGADADSAPPGENEGGRRARRSNSMGPECTRMVGANG